MGLEAIKLRTRFPTPTKTDNPQDPHHHDPLPGNPNAPLTMQPMTCDHRSHIRHPPHTTGHPRPRGSARPAHRARGPIRHNMHMGALGHCLFFRRSSRARSRTHSPGCGEHKFGDELGSKPAAAFKTSRAVLLAKDGLSSLRTIPHTHASRTIRKKGSCQNAAAPPPPAWPSNAAHSCTCLLSNGISRAW